MKLELSKYRAVAFDFDGTLADTIAVHTQARMEAFPLNGVHGVTAEQHELAHRLGNNPTTIIGGLLKQLGYVPQDADVYKDGLVQAVVDTKSQLYRKHAHTGLPENTGATDFYRKMVQRYGKDNVGVVTTAYDQEVYPFIERYDLGDIIAPELIVSADTVAELGIRGKPEGDAYVEFARRVSVDVSEVLVIEDSTGGIRAAGLAGCPSLAIGNTNPKEVFMDPVLEYHPVMFAESFEDIVLEA